MLFLKKLFFGFALAWSMLTAIPFVKVRDFFDGINGYAAMFYPIVGLILGGVLVSFFYLLQPLLPLTYLYVLTFVLWVAITGALHLDGVADIFDALFVPKERRDEVLKDAHIGAMGVIFTTLFILLKLATLMQAQLLYLLPLVLMYGRFNASLALFVFPYIRENGMATLAKKEFRLWQFVVMTLAVISIGLAIDSYIALWMMGLLFLPLILTAILAKKLFGGFSGDLYGLLIETSEWVLLHLLIFGAVL